MLLDFYDDAIAADCVLSDNVSGEYQLTEQLLKTGRRKIAFVGSVCSTNSIMDRYLGYSKALLRAGINRKKCDADRRVSTPTILPGRWLPAKTSPRRKPPL